MSINRRAAKRDGIEPAIRARLKVHGWHTEQVSGKGLPDLIGWSKHRVDVLLLEVKMPGKGPTPAQVTKWTELLTRGIRVYVLHTPNDVDYLVKGRLEPWTTGVGAIVTLASKKPTRGMPVPDEAEAAAVREFEAKRKANPAYDRRYAELRHGYIPPQTNRPDASTLATETFAPTLEGLVCPQRMGFRCGCTFEVECAEHSRGEA